MYLSSRLAITGQRVFPAPDDLQLRIGDFAITESTQQITDEKWVFGICTHKSKFA